MNLRKLAGLSALLMLVGGIANAQYQAAPTYAKPPQVAKYPGFHSDSRTLGPGINPPTWSQSPSPSNPTAGIGQHRNSE